MVADNERGLTSPALAYQLWLADWRDQTADAYDGTGRAAWDREKPEMNAKVRKAYGARERKRYAVPR